MKKLTREIINRLAIYYSILSDLVETGQKYVLSNELSTYLEIDDSQVRRDLSILECEGVRRKGYPVNILKHKIEQTLGFKNKRDAFIIGAGNLGIALAKYDKFEQYGFNITALFDCDLKKVGKVINNKKIYDIKTLEEFIKKDNVNIAILTVPEENAKETSEYLIEKGIKYIWNFSPIVLKPQKGICIKNQNLIGEFLQFMCIFEKDEILD